ncbi:MAG TPA: hypothetical protein VMJ64_10330 [Anaerolineales bacterium]|nr:hypothetical protein [Anaerolineales bacterium]
MSRFFILLAMAGMLGLAACGRSLGPPPVLPTIQAPAAATAEINQAYPTEQAQQSNASQTVSGFSVNLQRAWRDGKQVNANVCFTLPDASDWTVWNAHLEYGGQTVSEFSSSMLSRQETSGAEPGQRCDQLSFYVPPDANLSSSSLTIESLGAYPTQDEYCSLYMPKIQQALNDRGVAITLNCADTNGAMAMQITNKPDAMSQAEAEQLVYSDEFYTVKGPWSFPLTFSQ